MTAFIGIDWSLTGCGVAAYVDGDWDRITISTKPDDGTIDGYLERVHGIAAKVVSWATPAEGDIWAIEGPSFGAKSSALDRMFGGWWLTAGDLAEHHEAPWVFAPSSLKKLATGKGNANKSDVLLATERRVPEAGVSNDNEADAVWAAIGASILEGHPILELPKTHTAGLTRLLKGKS